MPTKVAICQVPDIRKDTQASLIWIEKFTGQAEDNIVGGSDSYRIAGEVCKP